MKKQPPPALTVGDVVAYSRTGKIVQGVITEIRPDAKAVIAREGKRNEVRALAFLERVAQRAGTKACRTKRDPTTDEVYERANPDPGQEIADVVVRLKDGGPA